MTTFRRGSGGRARPIVGRIVHMHTIVCRHCRRFCEKSLAPYAPLAIEAAKEAGWTDVQDGFGTCPECAGGKQ
jgi:hypothetical protein